MSELIDRQAAIEAMRKCQTYRFSATEPRMIMLAAAEEVIEELPSAQLEIIRCKDCENYQTDWQPLSFDDGHYCAMVDTIMPYDGFCHMGERREDERLNRQTEA